MNYEISEETKSALKAINEFTIERENGKKEMPILITAPDGSERGKLRLYGYGGKLGKFPIKNKDADKYLDGKYHKYLNPNGEYKNTIPSWISRNLPKGKTPWGDAKPDVDGYSKFLEKLISEKEGKNLRISQWQKWYFPLALAAAEARFTKEKDKKQMERRVQQLVAKQYQTHTGIFKDNQKLIITDIEFGMQIRKDGKNKICKPDFVAFDGERFGLIEMKYDGQSMGNGAENSLDVHFLDFYNAIEPSEQEKRYKECLRRLEILLTCGVIKEEIDSVNWKNRLEECSKKIENKQLPQDLFWVGFIFIGGDRKKISKYIKKQLIDPSIENYKTSKFSDERMMHEREIAREVKGKLNADKIYCQYCNDTENGDIKLDLSKTLKEVYEELSNANGEEERPVIYADPGAMADK